MKKFASIIAVILIAALALGVMSVGVFPFACGACLSGSCGVGALFAQGCQQTLPGHPSKQQEQKWIAVELRAECVEYCRDVLAWISPIRAGA